MHNSKFLVKKSPLQNRIWKYQDAFKKSISIIDCRIFVCFIWDGSKLLNWYDVIIFVKSIHHHQIFWVVLGRKIAREFFCMPLKFVFQENCRKYNKKWQFFEKVVTKSLGVSWLFLNILSHQGWTSYNSLWGRTLVLYSWSLWKF